MSKHIQKQPKIVNVVFNFNFNALHIELLIVYIEQFSRIQLKLSKTTAATIVEKHFITIFN